MLFVVVSFFAVVDIVDCAPDCSEKMTEISFDRHLGFARDQMSRKDKSTIQQHQIGGLPPRFQSSNASAQSSSPSTTIAQSSNQGVGGSDANRFSHDLSRMADLPPKNLGHRRAHSEILCLPDDISFDSDLGVVGSGDGPSLSDETEEDLFSMYMDMEKFNSSSATSGDASAVALAGESGGSSERPRIRHQHSQSMDGSTSIQPELLVSGSEGASLAESKKAMSAAKLADLALIDPKRAKRIWANRQSAARSKERKMRYIAELERKVQTLQTEATTLSLSCLCYRDTTGLTAENNELKLRVQTMEQQVHLQDALNDALREEVQRLKLVTGQTMSAFTGPEKKVLKSYYGVGVAVSGGLVM
ncbi:hypothetical protein Syun_005954 [Stephania yunnanensis]|uniref:BZIP domain-containing protein n=1 Tax=Stephania yunnanensis TaxID=152371 RepID=A0AAP0KVQ3_9MAGN